VCRRVECVRHVEFTAESSAGAFRLVASPLMLILVAFDRLIDVLLNSGVGFLNRCLNPIDLELGGSGWLGCEWTDLLDSSRLCTSMDDLLCDGSFWLNR
jgi:hypothetical protein